MLLNQFHDIIPGSSIARVNREAIATYERIEGELDAYAEPRCVADACPRDGGGRSPPSNLTEPPARRGPEGRRRLVSARRSPPYAAAALTPARQFPELAFTDDTLSNGILTLRFDADGAIVSCLDRRRRASTPAAASTASSCTGPLRLAVQRLGHQRRLREDGRRGCSA